MRDVLARVTIQRIAVQTVGNARAFLHVVDRDQARARIAAAIVAAVVVTIVIAIVVAVIRRAGRSGTTVRRTIVEVVFVIVVIVLEIVVVVVFLIVVVAEAQTSFQVVEHAAGCRRVVLRHGITCFVSRY